MGSGTNLAKDLLSNPNSESDLALTLSRANEGDQAALGEVFSMIYEDLRKRARRVNHGAVGATSLVHEAFLRVAGAKRTFIGDRLHFFNYATETLRRILIDSHRTRSSIKRGGAQPLLDGLDLEGIQTKDLDWGELDAALERLKAEHERQHNVVMLHFFGGCEFEEIAEMLGKDVRTVSRDWKAARAFLLKELDASGAD
jgi:RNA polymerase sigma factor (TIGR02999 family)